MRKLLSLFGMVTLVGSTAASVTSCRNRNTYNSNKPMQENINDDLETLNQITQKFNKDIEQKLFNKDIERNSVYMLNAYSRVSSDTKSYQLNDNNNDDLAIKDEFLLAFQAVFDNINREIKDDYSNFYPDSDPALFDKSSISLNLNFIDTKKLIALSNLNDITDLQAVAINFSVNYQVKFKNLSSDNIYNASFNMTNDLKKFNLVKGGTLAYFKANVGDFLTDKSEIDITTGEFKTLYDSFNIDYTQDITTIDNIYKNLFTNFIKNNVNLKDMITYNEDKTFLASQTTLFFYYDKGWYYNNRNGNNSASLHLNQWIKNGNVNEAKPEDFVKWYMKTVVPKLNVTSKLELGKFKFNLNYINLYGLTLSDYMNTNNSDFISTVFLTKDKLEVKLTNFANIIIAFLRYYKVEYKKEYYFNVSDVIWNKLIEDYSVDKLTNYSLPEFLLKNFIEDEDIIKQNLTDLNLFSFEGKHGWRKNKISYDENSNRFFFKNVGYSAAFNFGASNFLYMPFYYLWQYGYSVTKS